MWSRLKGVLEVVSTVAVVGLCAVVVWDVYDRRSPSPTPKSDARTASEGPLPTEPVSFALAQTKGGLTAKVGIIEYSDFQCPYCGVFARETLPQLMHDYVDTGKVLFAFQHLPIASLHPLATNAAVAADCAGEQAAFWPFHDRLFRLQGTLKAEAIEALGAELVSDRQRFALCQGSPLRRLQIDAQRERAARFGVKGTPTFLLGHVLPDRTIRVLRRLSGAQNMAAFAPAIDALLVPTRN